MASVAVFLSSFGLDGLKRSEPDRKLIRRDQCLPTEFDRTQPAGADLVVELGSTDSK
jgi:hypothetical protein